jgi:hypothetical protein
MRAYMREYRKGIRRGARKMVAGSRNWLKAHRFLTGRYRCRNLIEESIGPRIVPDGMTACPRCDLLTRRRDVCGFCAAEIHAATSLLGGIA